MWLIVSVPADSRFPRSIKSPRRSIRPKMSESQSPKAGAPDAAYHRGRAAIAGGAIAQGLDDLRRAADGGHRDAQVEAARVLMYFEANDSGLAEAVARMQTAALERKRDGEGQGGSG